MEKLERQILAIINDQGGSVPMDFFAKVMRQMVEDGRLKAVFPSRTRPLQYKYEYHVVKGDKK